MTLPTRINLRPASSGDETFIKRMVQAARINPIGLDWQRFVLATTPQGDIVGCGQIKPHQDGTHELASIVVEPGWRGQGIARKIIEHLISSHSGTLYLTCRGGLEAFYNRFEFASLPPDEMPPYYRRIYRLVNVLGVLGLAQEGLRVMRRE
jgi:N-acetylglutamate synthase-like GNAT family acetyltransferase